MANYLEDFHVERDPSGRVHTYSFRIGGCRDFEAALDAVKAIPSDLRHYEPERDHLWTVVAESTVDLALRRAFANFDSCLVASRQLSLFDDGEDL